MNHEQVSHFWTWFRKHNSLLLVLSHMSNSEREYWLREIDTHLTACTKKLSFALYYSHECTASLIITAVGKEKYFRMAENIASRAPHMPGWKIIALQPPVMISVPSAPIRIKANNQGADFLKRLDEWQAWNDNYELSDWVVNEKGELQKRKE
ncbi:MAG: hypothetical protein J7621_18060 [Niastella sp.]|nr:hypothetical protein [Niastella sp.]